MKRLVGLLFFYCLLSVLLLPLMVTMLCGGFRTELPQEAEGTFRLTGKGVTQAETGEFLQRE
ncbi:MAG: hypothetical protein Q4C06_06470 [Bacillota bacterium]|nr:hypothetical protein [Bacillota bacterium]